MQPDSPLGVGDAAPDFPLAVAEADATMLSDLRGDSVLVVLASPHWDPANDLLAARYPSVGVAAPAPRVVMERRPEIARQFGLGSGSALYVVDERGVIRWRWVAGVDVVPQSSVEGERMPLTVTRRDFVQSAMMAAAALAAAAMAPSVANAASSATEPTPPASRAGAMRITLDVNGRSLALDVEPRVTLLDALRERAGLTGTKKGCDHGQCGACTVHVDGRRVLSCLTLAVMAQGKAVTTIEGLAPGGADDALHPVQRAFIAHDGFQCGYCTPGQIMSAAAVLREPWGPSDDDVREAMSGNICRCGAYPGIVAAVQEARRSSASTQQR